VAIGFGDESLLALKRCSWMRLGIEDELARPKTSNVSVEVRKCMVNSGGSESSVMMRKACEFSEVMMRWKIEVSKAVDL
jgi:hypothetical protein